MAKDHLFNAQPLAEGLNLIKAIDNQFRLKIINFLKINAGATVRDIYKGIKLTQAETSQHLGKLRKYNLVTTVREAQKIRYFLNRERFNEIDNILRHHIIS